MKKITQGFTVVEVLASVLLFAIGITSLLTVYTQAMSVSKRSDYAYVAYNLAKNHAERLRATSFASLSTASETDTRINRDGEPDENGQFLRSTSVTPNYTQDANLTRVDVRVYYEYKKVKSPQSMDMTTVIFNG